MVIRALRMIYSYKLKDVGDMRTMMREKRVGIEDLRYNPDEGFRKLKIHSCEDPWLPPNVKQQKLVSLFWDRPKQRLVMTFD